jgi:hypothetical protein
MYKEYLPQNGYAPVKVKRPIIKKRSLKQLQVPFTSTREDVEVIPIISHRP